jgi:hypothetical protein
MSELEALEESISCDFATGALRWRVRPEHHFGSARKAAAWNARFAGSKALAALNRNGYRHGSLGGRSLQAHRVVFALGHGRWPSAQVDHINGVRTDNRLVNLREATNKENSRNAAASRRNTSGVPGVCKHTNPKFWFARIKVDGREIYLGLFTRFEDAVAARKAAEKQFGFHANHGRTNARKTADLLAVFG